MLRTQISLTEQERRMLEARLLTRNVRHFPMFTDLASPY
jgi:hypothetical protein